MVFMLGVMMFVIFGFLMAFMPLASFVIEIFLINLLGKDLYFVFFWDIISFLFCLIVVMISFSVFFYSNYYMDSESSRLGFMVLLLTFVFSMLLLLLSPNLLSLLLGWDGLGMTSYLLVIYYSSYSSSTAGMLTFLVNRLGDVFFLLSLGFMALLFDWEKFWSPQSVLIFFMFLALSTKSAQVPFSAWLPAAMAAPTPVSSLVHSSTLVTAGLYLMIRFYYLLSSFSLAMLYLGIFTLLAAGLMALFEWDLKKLIAFSTLSQLGFMVSSFAMGLVWVSFFHLLTHALFKASLFLSAGVLIHNADNSQEFRNMFSVPAQLFWVSGIVNICLLCLCGIPFTSGFYSKDLIVDGGAFSYALFSFYLLGVLFTVIYSSRFFFYSHRFFMLRLSYVFSYDKVLNLFVPLLMLVLAAVSGGWFFFEFFFSFKFMVLVSSGWKMFYFLFLGAMFMISFKFNVSVKRGYKNNFFFSTIWYLKNVCSSKFWKSSFLNFSIVFSKGDQGMLEVIGPQGVIKSVMSWGSQAFSFQSFIFLLYFLVFLVSMFFL